MHRPHRVQSLNREAIGKALIVEQNAPGEINGRLVEYLKFYRVRSDKDVVLDRQTIVGLHLWSGTTISISAGFAVRPAKRAVEGSR